MRMRLVVLSCVACLDLQYFSTLSHKGHEFLEKIIEHKICHLIFSTIVVRHVSHSKKH
jgi:predicted SprT family Zn-dependent metalloprotease